MFGLADNIRVVQFLADATLALQGAGHSPASQQPSPSEFPGGRAGVPGCAHSNQGTTEQWGWSHHHGLQCRKACRLLNPLSLNSIPHVKDCTTPGPATRHGKSGAVEQPILYLQSLKALGSKEIAYFG